MITILTENDCIQFNLKHFEREKDLIRVLQYHKTNMTEKKIRVSSDPEIKICPLEVVDAYFEPRKYYPSVGKAIDKMIEDICNG